MKSYISIIKKSKFFASLKNPVNSVKRTMFYDLYIVLKKYYLKKYEHLIELDKYNISFKENGNISIYSNKYKEIATLTSIKLYKEIENEWEKVNVEVPNGTFEKVDNNNKPVGWQIKSKSKGSDIFVKNNCGSNNLVVDISDIFLNNHNVLLGPKIKVNNIGLNDAFQLKFDTKMLIVESNNKVNHGIRINYLDSNKRKMYDLNLRVRISANDTWEKKKIDFKMPINAKYLQFKISHNHSIRGSFFYDNFLLNHYKTPNLQGYKGSWKKDLVENDRLIMNWEAKSGDYLLNTNAHLDYSTKELIVYKYIKVINDLNVSIGYSKIISNKKVSKLLHRDLKWVKPKNGLTVVDRWTPKKLKLKKSFSIFEANGWESLEVYNKKDFSEANFFLFNYKDTPNFTFSRGGEKCWDKYQPLSSGTVYKTSMSLSFDKNDELMFKSKFSGKKEAIISLTHHADKSIAPVIESIMYGTNNKGDEDYGNKGIIGHKLTATWSVFNKSSKLSEGLDVKEYFNLFKELNSQIEIILHTASRSPNNREEVAEALKAIQLFDARNWIDHGLAGGTPSSGIKSEGAKNGSDYYVLDLLKKHGYDYVWAYIDTDVEGINQLLPFQHDVHTPLLYAHNNLRLDNFVLWQWVTWRKPAGKLLDSFKRETIDLLIKQHGISLLHEYFSLPKCEGYFYHETGEKVYKIDDKLDKILGYIGKLKEQGVLWVATIEDFGDYQRALEKVTINKDITGYKIVNKGYKIKEFSIWVGNLNVYIVINSIGQKVIGKSDVNGDYLKFDFELPSGETIISIKEY